MNWIFRVFRIKELRTSILIVLGMLVVFRLAAHIPVPGVDASSISQFLASNQILGLLNVFSGGTLESFSIVALGVGPYITSSIIFQLLGMIVPRMEELQKEEQGRRKITQWSRIATVPLALLQAYGLIILFSQQGGGLGLDLRGFETLLAVITMTAGTIFLMWLGELISERNIGNGISILIFAGIIAGLPTFFQQTFATFDRSQLFDILLFIILFVVTILAVVLINEGQRNIPVQYARMQQGARSLGGVSSHIPLRVNMGGMIPIIFAISLVLFPPTMAQFFLQAKSAWIAGAAQWVIQIFQNQLFYAIIYFLLVFGFTFFYAGVVFRPEQIAENIQKQGGFIPGIRPGRATAEYLQWVTNRILFVGGFYLATIAILPNIAQYLTGSQQLIVGGSSVIIVVSVVIDLIKQVEAQIAMHEYEYR
ncbi:MAG: preprotein translocase subunit SecY [Patescibacteria group bacterium]